MTSRCVLLLVALVSPSPGQEERPLRQRALDMLHDALREQGAYATLERLVRAAPKRLSGSPGAAAAVEWARQEMTRIGLTNVRLEEVTVPRWVRGDTCRVVAVVPGGGEVPLAACALGGSIGTPADGIEARVVEVKSLGQLRAMKGGAKGAIVLFNRPFDVTLRNTFMGTAGR